jgi:putative endonuclease
LNWYCYILRCADGTLYTGISNDLDKRLAAHNAGSASKYTRVRLPVAVVYAERQADRSCALQRELEIKRLSRQAKLCLAASCKVPYRTSK